MKKKERVFKILMCLCSFFLCVIFSVSVQANTKTIANFDYSYKMVDNGDIWITRITPCKGKDISELKIPSYIEGKKVVKLGDKNDTTDDVAADNIFGVYRSEDDEELKPEKVIKQVKKIGMHALTGIHVKDLYIPASVTKIETPALPDKNYVRFHVSKKNAHYASTENYIYSKVSGRLVAISCKSSTLKVPKKVTKLTNMDISGKPLKRIIVSASIKSLEDCCSINYGWKKTYVFKSKTPPKFKGHFEDDIKFIVPKGQREKYLNALRKLEWQTTVNVLEK